MEFNKVQNFCNRMHCFLHFLNFMNQWTSFVIYPQAHLVLTLLYIYDSATVVSSLISLKKAYTPLQLLQLHKWSFNSVTKKIKN